MGFCLGILIALAVAVLVSPFSLTSQQSPITGSQSVSNEIEALTLHPGITWNASTPLSFSRKKLQRRHTDRFTWSSSSKPNDCLQLFERFARAVCRTGSVARKEVYETWAAALYIDGHFFSQHQATSVRRVADVGAGHGLLAWALLVLDEYGVNRKVTREQFLTAFCVDSKMPKSVDRIEEQMIAEFPSLAGRFDFVEARLEQLRPHSSCLLASVHACGSLSDLLVASAAEHQAPIAVVPCCHSRKKKQLTPILNAEKESLAHSEYEAIFNIGEDDPIPNLAEELDQIRMTILERAGFEVNTKFLPDIFTAKTRLILAKPPNDIPATYKREPLPSKPTLLPGRMPPIVPLKSNAKEVFLQKFDVPCADTSRAREKVCALAGREAATQRRNALHRRNHADTSQLDLTLWLSEPHYGSNFDWENALSRHGSSCYAEVKRLGPVFVNEKLNRKSQTFRLSYYRKSNSERIEKLPVGMDEAKKLHSELSRRIRKEFPGVECR